mmetsp:Transcript_37021/g.104529  ORF Transcript_37021/g.104529 Transcript_37021/m.104529 type:complete len:244 (-) Transcript_37021:533-1264(-)
MAAHHLINVPREEAAGLEAIQDGTVGEAMHVRPGHARLHGANHRLLSIKDSVVHNLLVLGELSVDWEGCSNVRVVPVVLAAHVAEHHVAVAQLPVIRRPCMAVVQHCPIGPRGTDGRVGRVTAAASLVAVAQEDSLQLVLHHAGRALPHYLNVAGTGNVIGILHGLDFQRGLVDSAFGEDGEKQVGLRGELRYGLKLRRLDCGGAVSVGACKGVKDRRLGAAQHRRHLINIVGFVHAVFFLHL